MKAKTKALIIGTAIALGVGVGYKAIDKPKPPVKQEIRKSGIETEWSEAVKARPHKVGRR